MEQQNGNLEKLLALLTDSKKSKFMILVIARLMFLFLGIFPVLTYGYSKPVGFGYVFSGFLSDSASSRFIVGMMFVDAIIIAAREFFITKPISRVNDILNTILFGVGILLFITFVLTLPGGSVTVTGTGSVFYLLLSLIGLVVSLLPLIFKDKLQ